jgi:hypothetical protein
MKNHSAHEGESVDGLCAYPDCDREISTHLSEPLCEPHILRVYRSALMLIGEKVPAMVDRVKRPNTSATPGHVYFISFGSLIKIGFSTNIQQRLRVLPHDELLAKIPGTMRDEKVLHRQFAHLRQQGEWFRKEPDLLAYIDTLTDAA